MHPLHHTKFGFVLGFGETVAEVCKWKDAPNVLFSLSVGKDIVL